MKLVTITTVEMMSPDLSSSGKLDVLGELGVLLSKNTPLVSADAITKTLVDRERLATTGVGEGVAIPHGKIDGIEGVISAWGLSRTGIAFDAVDGNPVHIFVALLAPQSSSGDHLRALARVSRLLKDPEVRAKLLGARTSEELFEMIREEDDKY